MTKTITNCDCCQKKDIETSIKVKMPVIAHYKEDVLGTAEMDLCEECANRFLQLYYEIAKEHGSSGIHMIYED